jgi:hypothetical protein
MNYVILGCLLLFLSCVNDAMCIWLVRSGTLPYLKVKKIAIGNLILGIIAVATIVLAWSQK